VGYTACVGDIRNVYKILVGIPKGKRSLWSHGYRWENNIKIDLKITKGQIVLM
jgi:hypothetical protein